MFSLVLSLVVDLAVVAASVTVSVPLTSPSGALTLSPTLVSFSIEGDRWTDWAGTTSRNQFTFNALNNLKSLTGSSPSIRVGANSEDHTLFSSSVEFTQDTFPPPTSSVPYGEATTVLVGDGYYAASRFLPSGTHMTWGVDFGQNNLTAATEEAKSIIKAFKSGATKASGVILDFIEIGNEPDLYGGSKRNGTWDTETYVTQWSSFAESVASAIGIRAGSKPLLQGLAFAGSDHGAGGFSPQQAFADGILTTPAGKLIGIISEHKYSGGCCTALVSDLMSKSFVRGNLSVYAPDVAATQAQGLTFVFGETNNYFNHGVPDVSDSAGAALWLIDYSLFAATLGISNLFFHGGIGYKYNLIQPSTLTLSSEDATPLNPPEPPHVQAPYYGAIVIAEFLGNTSPRTFQEISFSSSTLSGYALFGARGALKKVLLINSEAFLTGQSSRPSTTVFLDLPKGGPKSMVLKRLAIPHADALTGLTWGGQTYETSDAIVKGSLKTTTSHVSSGVTISTSEVVLVTFT